MPAYAGAWIAPEGGQTIWTELAGERDDVFYSESSYYLEAPIGEDVSFVAMPWVTQNPDQIGVDGLKWDVTLGGKWALHRGAHAVTALQGAVVWDSEPLADCAEAQAELRWLGGASFSDGRGFANLETAERVGPSGCGGERLDLSVGYRVQEHWLGMTQIFVDEPRLGDGSVRAQVSFVHFGAGGRGLQIGLRARVDGEAAEPALLVGFWGQGRH